MLAFLAAVAVFAVVVVLLVWFVLPLVGLAIVGALTGALPPGGEHEVAGTATTTFAILGVSCLCWLAYRSGHWWFSRRALPTPDVRRGPRSLWSWGTVGALLIALPLCYLGRHVPVLVPLAVTSGSVAAGMVSLFVAAAIRQALAAMEYSEKKFEMRGGRYQWSGPTGR